MVSKAAQAAAQRRKANSAVHATKHAWANASSSLETAATIARKKIDATESQSHLFARGQEQLDVIPKFGIDDLALGRVLGKGGFATVTEIRSITCDEVGVNGVSDRSGVSRSSAGSGPSAPSYVGDGEDEDEAWKDQEAQDKKFIADHCLRDGGDARYCIKTLSPDVIADQQLFTQGVIDMCIETVFLSAIDHPHIVTMRAFGIDGMYGPNYFLVLDRLYDTLEARIPKWKLQSRKAKSFANKLKKSTGGKLDELMETRLCYAYDLMGAFEYLHRKKLVYRDLKPENVGFNIRDDIMMFDFGLAREVHDEEKVSDGAWKLTGETGSLRYMAPEVCTNQPYGYSADVYSFGILLWEILKMEKPFAGYSKKMHAELIVTQGGRPKVDAAWGASLVGFLHACWHQDRTKRPTAAKASVVLKREADKVTGGNRLELNNFRRKSTFVNRNALRERKNNASSWRGGSKAK